MNLLNDCLDEIVFICKHRSYLTMWPELQLTAIVVALFFLVIPESSCFTVVTTPALRTNNHGGPSSMRLFGSAAADLTSRLDLDDRFGRWRYLQMILEEETNAQDTNKILFCVLDGYLKYPRPSFRDDSEETGSPEMTAERKSAVESLLQQALDGEIPVLIDSEEDMPANELILQQLEKVLPDPVEDEDGMKCTWDNVMNLYGREGVRINEQSAEPGWTCRCLIARILLYHDFLTYGLIDSPLS